MIKSARTSVSVSFVNSFAVDSLRLITFGLCEYWINNCAVPLPAYYVSRLIARRNAASHRGRELLASDVRDPIWVTTDIVAQTSPLPPAEWWSGLAVF